MACLYCSSSLQNHILAAQDRFLPYLLLKTHSSEAQSRQEDAKTQWIMLQLFTFNKPASEEEKIPLKISFREAMQIPSKLITPIPDTFIETFSSEPLNDLDEELPQDVKVTKLDVLVNALYMHELSEDSLIKNCSSNCQSCKDRYFAQLLAGEMLLESNKDLGMLFLSCAIKSAESLNLPADSKIITTTQKRELKRLKVGSPSTSRCTSVTARSTPGLYKQVVIRVLFNPSATQSPVSASPAPDG